MKKTIKKKVFFEKLLISFLKPSLEEKTNFFRLLSVAQKAWIWIRESLVSIKKSEKNKWFKSIIQDLINRLTEWYTLSTAMEYFDYIFSVDEIALVRSAEAMWNLPEVLSEIAIELENLQKIKQKIKKAMTYPTILILLSIIAVVILLVVVMPTIVKMFPSKQDLPSITKIMLNVSDFLKIYRVFLLWIFVWLYLLFKFLYESVLSFKVFIDYILVKLPIVSWVVKTFYMYRFSKLLWQFYSAWISPVVALKLMSNIVSNFTYKQKILEIREDLENWFNFYDSMDWSYLFDPILVQIIHVGEDTWEINNVLLKISDFYHNLLDTKIAMLLAIIEPLLMIIVSIMIWSIVGAIYLPMIWIVDTIQ